MDDVSECDWTPPPEIEIAESEVFQIPSGLPSLEEFVRTELEKEAIAAAAEAASKLEGEDEEALQTEEAVHYEDLTTMAIAEDGDEDAQATGGDFHAAADTMKEEQSDDYFEVEEPEVKKTKKRILKSTEDWYDIDVKIDFSDMERKVKEQAQEELRIRLIASTHEYLDNLIDKVVEVCEYEDPDEILRARLDKNHISKVLDEKLLQLFVEQKVAFFLHRKTVEYFRRKKATRPLMDDNPEEIINELRKYREALLQVNKIKGREIGTKSMLATKIADLRQEVSVMEMQAEQKSNEFVELVRKVFDADSSDKMDTLVSNLTNKMKNMRKEISKLRFIYIQKQHTMATLLDKAKKLETLGNGLRMADFEHLQTENQALGKKIEERNNELNRLQTRCNADIHTLAHIREKQHMIRNIIAAQQETYNATIQEKKDCREYLNSMKIKHGSIRREIQKISFQGGLLDKPELLLDYDDTVVKAEVLRAKVSEMKAAQLAIDNKIKYMIRSLE